MGRKHIKSEYEFQNQPNDKKIPYRPFDNNCVAFQKFHNLFHIVIIDNCNNLSMFNKEQIFYNIFCKKKLFLSAFV